MSVLQSKIGRDEESDLQWRMQIGVGKDKLFSQ